MHNTCRTDAQIRFGCIWGHCLTSGCFKASFDLRPACLWAVALLCLTTQAKLFIYVRYNGPCAPAERRLRPRRVRPRRLLRAALHHALPAQRGWPRPLARRLQGGRWQLHDTLFWLSFPLIYWMSINRSVDFSGAWFQFHVLNYTTCLVWMVVVVQPTHPKGICRQMSQNIHKTQMKEWSTYSLFWNTRNGLIHNLFAAKLVFVVLCKNKRKMPL